MEEADAATSKIISNPNPVSDFLLLSFIRLGVFTAPANSTDDRQNILTCVLRALFPVSVLQSIHFQLCFRLLCPWDTSHLRTSRSTDYENLHRQQRKQNWVQHHHGPLLALHRYLLRCEHILRAVLNLRARRWYHHWSYLTRGGWPWVFICLFRCDWIQVARKLPVMIYQN